MRITLLVVLSLFIVACSSVKKDKKDIQEKAASSQVTDAKGLGQSIETHIENSKTLTDAQKQELRSILGENKRVADELSAKSFQFRGVLVQELLSGKATKRRIRILEKDIEAVEKLRLKNTFDTVKKISKIVAGQPDKNEFAQEIIHFEGPPAGTRY